MNNSIISELITILVGSVKHKGNQPLTTQYLLNILKAAEKRHTEKEKQKKHLDDMENEAMYDAENYGCRE